MNTHINLTQRYEISALKKAGKSNIYISESFNLHKSTIGRELKRNMDKGKYHPVFAQEFANLRKQEKPKRHTFSPQMKAIVNEKLLKKWSPEQIVGRCNKELLPMVSHETIYKYIWKDKQSNGKLYEHLRNSSKKYKKRYGKTDKRGQIPNKISIETRGIVIDNKERIGDWEIDLIIGKNHKGAIVTATERKTNYELIAPVKSKSSKQVKKALINMFAPYKEQVLSITSDNGREFFEHQAIAKKLACKYYFAHPYSSWERGLNEYQNKLIRQFIPKKMELQNIESRLLLEIQNNLNSRPRKKLGFCTPNELFLHRRLH